MASILQRLFGGGGTKTTPTIGTNPYGANPYTTGGAQPMNIGGFKPAPAGFQWGTGSQGGTGFTGGGFTPSIGGAMNAVNALGGIGGRTGGLFEEKGPKEKDQREPKGKLGKIRELLTGESGAAIGGIAQGAGTVLGAYMNRKAQGEVTKLERQRFEEEMRRQKLREEQYQSLRNLLMPTIQKYTP